MDCIASQTINVDDWFNRLKAPLNGGRYPLTGSMELTNRCNMGCVHCYINQPANDQTARSQELSTEQVCQIIDQLVEAGSLFLTFTGGEPLLRPDFSEIYRYARQRGLLPTLFTNGTMLTPEIADMLQRYRPMVVEISLYGATQDVYEAVTRVPGSFAACRRGIDLLLERGVPLMLKSSIIKTNFPQLHQMRALADQLGVDYRYDGILWPRLDKTGPYPNDLQISMEDLLNFDDEDAERRQSIIKEVERLAGHTTRDERVYACGAGLASYHIDWQGRLSICMMARKTTYDLKHVPFIEAWEKIGILRQQKRTSPSPCLSCIMNTFCSQCPGWSQAVHGDDETVVDFICELGRLRSQKALTCQTLQIEEKL